MQRQLKKNAGVCLNDGTQPEFDYLIIANGHHSVPRHPDWKEDFTGKYLHAHEYKTSHGLENKRMLVVGAGNSGCDCAVESSCVAARVDISLRSPQYIIPKFIYGPPHRCFRCHFPPAASKRTGLATKNQFASPDRTLSGLRLTRTGLPSHFGHTQLLTQRYLIRFGTVKYILALASGKFPEKPYILTITLQHSMMYSSPRPATKSASRFLIGIFLTGKKLITFHFSCEYFTLITPACFLLA